MESFFFYLQMGPFVIIYIVCVHTLYQLSLSLSLPLYACMYTYICVCVCVCVCVVLCAGWRVKGMKEFTARRKLDQLLNVDIVVHKLQTATSIVKSRCRLDKT